MSFACKPKFVHISMKHADACFVVLSDKLDKELFEHDGYMPEFNKATHVLTPGDYTEICVDNETGKIIGWDPIVEVEDDDES